MRVPAIENALLASVGFIFCVLTRNPNCNIYKDESNFIQDVDSPAKDRAKFPVFWNVPTFQCHKYGMNFSRVSSTWGITQNNGDEFRGEVISILYDPGEFPALLEAPPMGTVSRNGGIPQEGSLTQHLRHFKAHVEKLIPWEDFSGLGILDFEHWRPIFHQNWGSLNVYRQQSRLTERKKHPFWFYSMINSEATYRFELAAKIFLQETLKAAKLLRPKAKWGYYGYPFCFNYTPYNNKESCSNEVIVDNDKMEWLFSETTAHYPSLYLKERDMGSSTRKKFVRGRLHEAIRVAKGAPVYPYIWYKYHDSRSFLTPEDMAHVIEAPRNGGCNGVVIWGASMDVNSLAKCQALADYVENVLGPAIEKINENYVEFESTTEITSEPFEDSKTPMYTEVPVTETSGETSEETSSEINGEEEEEDEDLDETSSESGLLENTISFPWTLTNIQNPIKVA